MQFSLQCPACKGSFEAAASLSGRVARCPYCAAPVVVPAPRVEAGVTLAGFRLERLLGKGGMGEVWLARQLSVDRPVAVKVLPPGFAENPEAVKRFLHEGKLAARLDHANIVTVFEAGEDTGNYYLAMAYIEGESLEQRLKRDRALPEPEALTIARAMAEALAYAWEKFRLLHRDIKPANIMVDRGGRVFLMDLGLAKSLGDESGLTLSGSILGTPQYMSPEQAQSLADLGVPTDVYSLGATLYHLVTGTLPFSADSALKMLNMHVHAPLPRPRDRNPKVTDACSQLIEAMMAKKPADRYGDWRALIADIDRVLQGRAPSVHRLGAGASVAAAATGQGQFTAAKADAARPAQEAPARRQQAQQPVVTPAAPTRAKRPSWLAIGLSAATVAVLVLVGAMVTSQRGRPAPSAPGTTAAPAATAAAGPAPTAVPAVAPSATEVAPKPEPAGSAAASPAAPTPPPPAPPVLGQPWTVPGLGLELVWVAPGGFQMGSGNTVDRAAQPEHTVRISRGYWLGACEVTQAEYEAVTGTNPSAFRGERNPVEMVSWTDAAAFCAKLTEQERKAGRLPPGHEYRLPTEAEWEYAARGGAGSRGLTYSGSNTVDEVAWYGGNSGGRTCLVGLKKPNELGLHDMSGNVWEWCLDWFDASYYARSPGADPANLQATGVRVGHGGNWGSPAEGVRTACRHWTAQGVRARDLGYRVCLGPAIPVAADSVAAAPPKAPAAPAPPSPAPPVLGQPWTVPGLGLELVPIPAGTFQMGSASGAEKPVHQVAISRPFWLGKYEVTQAEYQAVGARAGGDASFFKGARRPAERIWWVDVEGFCAKLTERERAAGRLPAGYAYRAPTEAEWEYACRAGTTGDYAGSLDDMAWLKTNSGQATHDVGTKRANAWGLYDMHGNVREWCLDWYSESFYAQAKSPVTDPVNTQAATHRVLRGGSWLDEPAYARSASRQMGMLGNGYWHFGFRVCLGPPPVVAGGEPGGDGYQPRAVGAAAPAPPVLGQPWTVPGLGLELVWVPAGTFQMGSSDGGDDEKPVHQVTISRGFWIGRYEVTQAEYETVTGRSPSELKGPRDPVGKVSWDDATVFCAKLTERERAAGRVPVGHEYRLPTEAEWEYAARGGTKSGGFTYSGSNSVSDVAWYQDNSGGKTHPVGGKKPNELGLYDMSGNVWEWCHDWYGAYPSGPATDPRGARTGSVRVDRGGSRGNSSGDARLARRGCFGPQGTAGHVGLRVCLGPQVGAAAATAAGPVQGNAWTVPDLGLELVWVTPGSFQMGSDTGQPDQRPVHTVRIPRGYRVGKYEVTQAEYQAIAGVNPSTFRDAHNPVDTVSWNDAVAFCVKLTQREGAAGRLPAGYEYRLPTEAEWDYAARGGSQSRGFIYSGSNTLDEVAWYKDNSGDRTHPVGQKKPNELGLYDLTGNAWEWCDDWFGNYPSGTVTDPRGTAIRPDRVSRAGGYDSVATACQVASRNWLPPSGTYRFLGFRVALAPSLPAPAP